MTDLRADLRGPFINRKVGAEIDHLRAGLRINYHCAPLDPSKMCFELTYAPAQLRVDLRTSGSPQLYFLSKNEHILKVKIKRSERYSESNVKV